jgi:AcrR family transcriptional regulator
MPKGFTEHEKELIRQRLLEQGYKQFSIYGLKKTNIEALADASGISKGAFYLFYESKEVLFMDVIELAEKRFRQEVLAVIDLPGPSPRSRFFAVLKKAFWLLKTIPILQFLTGNDFDLLFRRLPPEKLAQHMASDSLFIEELITRCENAGIPIRVKSAELSSLLYPLVLSILHQDDFGPYKFDKSIDVLLDLVAAFCLGEVQSQAMGPVGPTEDA